MVRNHARKDAARNRRRERPSESHRQAVGQLRGDGADARRELSEVPAGDDIQAVATFFHTWNEKATRLIEKSAPAMSAEDAALIARLSSSLATAVEHLVCQLEDELFNPYLVGRRVTDEPDPETVKALWQSLLQILRPLKNQPGFPARLRAAIEALPAEAAADHDWLLSP
ncbi:hypothetical protein [Streptomyces sp. NPDC058268]|uniref:hypothetical protein n=1 Tax=Streptomyces sp. NPDC058268 TaxID=3346413 RepID=UPI0036E33AB0